MALVGALGRWWLLVRWPLYAALGLSLAGLFIPLPSWMQFLGLVGVGSALAISDAAPWLNEGLAAFFGFLVNVAVWAALLVGVAALTARFRRGHAIAH